MSFSKEVKEELSRLISKARHCQIAEIAAIINLCGKITFTENEYVIKINTENITVARKYFTLIKNIFQINAEILIRRNVYLKKSRTYTLSVKGKDAVIRVLKTVKISDEVQVDRETAALVSSLIVQNTCCKRAFLRGAFLASGSISDPEKTYHFEIVTARRDKAVQLQELIHAFEINAKITIRKKYFIVYIKEGAQIVDMLNIMGAHKSLMDLENVRIVKEMRNAVNRQVNCETANLNKTVSAAVKQLEDIKFIQNTIGFSELSEGLLEIALLRLNSPQATLKELGELLNPKVGKSGVNHRLRKLSDIADNLRNV